MKKRVYLDTGVWILLNQAGIDASAKILTELSASTTIHVSAVHLMDLSGLTGETTRSELGQLIASHSTNPLFKPPVDIFADELLNLFHSKFPSKNRRSIGVNASPFGSTHFDVSSFQAFNGAFADSIADQRKRGQFAKSVFRAIPWVPDVKDAVNELNAMLKGSLPDLVDLAHSIRQNAHLDPAILALRTTTPTLRMEAMERGIRSTVAAWLNIIGVPAGSSDWQPTELETDKMTHLWSNLAVTFLQGVKAGRDKKGNDGLDALHASYIPDVDLLFTTDGPFHGVLTDDAFLMGMDRLSLRTKVFLIKHVSEIPGIVASAVPSS